MQEPQTAEAAERHKRNVALSSVAAAILLTGMKLVVGLATGSLGILAEAAHFRSLFDKLVNGKVETPGHGRNLLADALTMDDEQRVHEIVDGQLGLAD